MNWDLWGGSRPWDSGTEGGHVNEIPSDGGPLNLYKWVYVAEGWGGGLEQN